MNTTPQHRAVESLYATGKWFLDAGHADKALDVFRMILLVAPSDERGWLGLGACHESLGQSDTALELYVLGADAAKSARCHVARARALRSVSRDAEAAAAIDDAEATFHAHDDDEDLGLLLAAERRES